MTAAIFRRRLVLCSPTSISRFKLGYSAQSFSASSADYDVKSPTNFSKGKKVPKAQRRAMIQAYITKYKEMNDGKFPSVSDTRKHVGGCYYVVKKIFQELQSNSSMSNLEKEIVVDNECLTEVEEVSESKISVDAGVQDGSQRVATSCMDIVNISAEDLNTEKGSHTLSSSETTFSNEILDPDSQSVGVATSYVEIQTPSSEKFFSKETVDPDSASDHVTKQSNLLDGNSEEISHTFIEKSESGLEEVENNHSDFATMQHHLLEDISHPHCEKTENHMDGSQAQGSNVLDFVETDDSTRGISNEEDNKKQKVAEDIPDKDGEKHKAKPCEGTLEPDKVTVILDSKQTTFWGNLKSFADGILSLWRKE